MNSEMVKSVSDLKDPNNNNPNISVRLERYLNHIKRLKSEKTQHLLEEAEARLVQQQELHNKDLDDLREQYETQLQASREKMEALLKTKLKTAEMASRRDRETLEHTLKTLSATQIQIADSEYRVIVLEETKSTLTDNVRTLQTGLEIEKSEADKLQAEVERLREQLASKREEHQHLMKAETDNSLGLEIAQFSFLLSQEEKRMKVSSS